MSERPAPTRNRIALGVAGALGVALLLDQALFRSISATGYGDYQFFHHDWELGRVAWSRYGELPLWDPYQCGGIPDWGDPQTQVHHPLFFLCFVLGSTLALKLFILLHAAAGLGGMFVYARRRLELGPAASAFAAVAWAGSGFFAWHVGTGHGGFVAFNLLPWLLLAWHRAVTDLRWSAAVAGVLVLALLAGGAYVFPYFLLVLALEAGVELARERRLRGAILAALASGTITALAGAWRLLPVIEHMRLYPRANLKPDHVSARELLYMLTSTKTDLNTSGLAQGHAYGWSEYGSYLGTAVIVLGLLGFLLATRERRHLLLGALAFGLLVLGDFGRYSPWALLGHLPLYSQLRVPTRFAFALSFYLVLAAALAVDRLLERGKSLPALRGARHGWVSLGVVVALALPIVLHHRAVLAKRWSEPALGGAVADRFHLVWAPNAPRVRSLYPPPASFPRRNLGTGFCYTGLGYFASPALWVGDVPQARVMPEGKLLGEGRTTRTAWADVELPSSGRVVFNQTWAPGWVTSTGRMVLDAGRVAVALPRGRHRVVLSYAPVTLGWAAGLSLAGLLAALLLARRRFSSDVSKHPLVAACAFVLALASTGLAYARAIALSEAVPRPERTELEVTASSFIERNLNDLYRPERATDDDPRSEWILPDATAGYIEARFPAPIHVAGVSLRDARNLPYDDRRTTKLAVEAYRGNELLKRVELELDPAAPATLVPVSLELDRVERIRVVIERWERKGGGLAELDVY